MTIAAKTSERSALAGRIREAARAADPSAVVLPGITALDLYDLATVALGRPRFESGKAVLAGATEQSPDPVLLQQPVGEVVTPWIDLSDQPTAPRVESVEITGSASERAEGFWWVRWRGASGFHVMRPNKPLGEDETPLRIWQEPRWRIVEMGGPGRDPTVVDGDDRWEWGPYLGKEPGDDPRLDQDTWAAELAEGFNKSDVIESAARRLLTQQCVEHNDPERDVTRSECGLCVRDALAEVASRHGRLEG